MNAHIRQLGLIDPADLHFGIMTVGAGSIGSFALLALAKMGCQNLTVLDFDTVEMVNTAAQLYSISDIGLPKVEALQHKIEMLTDYRLTARDEMWGADTREQFSDRIIISAVDSMDVRRALFERHEKAPKYFIDARMGGNALFIYTFDLSSAEACARYRDTLFTDEEADPEPCSERSVVYNTLSCGGLIASLVARIANNQSYPFETIVDLRNFTMEGVK